MNKHTPGPWHAVSLFTSDIPENAMVCIHAAPKSDMHSATKVAEAAFAVGGSSYHVDNREEAEANARLIAAAPETAAERDRLREINAELLDALTEIVAAADGDGWKQLDATFAAPRAAIAKAKGVTP